MSSWSKTQYAGYLFDLDGTLIDTAPDLNLAQNAALREFGYQPADEAQTRHWVGYGARALLEQALTAQAADHQHLDEMHQFFLRYYEANIAETSKAYPSVVDTLAKLRARGAKLAVVTNKMESLSHILLTQMQLLDRFDLLVGGDSAEHPKPDPAPAVLACAQLQLEPEQVLFVGDSTTDVGCARNFGCPVVCVSYGYNQGTPPAELGADGVIETFAELV